jgi:hypothetical protein
MSQCELLEWAGVHLGRQQTFKLLLSIQDLTQREVLPPCIVITIIATPLHFTVNPPLLLSVISIGFNKCAFLG